MFIHRWQGEIEEALKYKSAIILYNNVKDMCLYQAPNVIGTYELLPISEYLVRIAKQTFKTVRLYDPVDKAVNCSDQTQSDDSKCEEADEYSPSPAMKTSAPKESSVERDLFAILRDFADSEGCGYIFTHADKTFQPKPTNPEDLRSLVLLDKMITRMKPSNRLILLFAVEDNIPIDLYKNNPYTKMVNIPPPDRADLRFFFKDHEKAPSAYIDKAVNSSHGLRFLEVEQLISGISPFDINKYEDAVKVYKFGEKRDYWQEVSLEKLNKAPDFFENEDTESGREGITGQNNAIDRVIGAIENAVADIQRRTGGNPARPKGVLFFAGPTGVGKTLTAQKLASFLFGSEEKLLRFDMSEYKDEFQVTRLYGAPPGYVGFDSGGTLTSAIKANPFSVILFDEIEKAHPRIFDIFLQILSDGRLTDSKGETVYFSESIIIFTSNIGVRSQNRNGESINEEVEINRLRASIKNCKGDSQEYEKWKNAIQKHFINSVENFFVHELSRKELLNRVGKDNIIVFDYISDADAKKILENYLQNLMIKFNKTSASESPVLSLKMDYQAVAAKMFEFNREEITEYGGRNVVNLIDTQIRNNLARIVLDAKFSGIGNGTISVTMKDNGKPDVRLD